MILFVERVDNYISADQLSGLKISVDGAICGYVIGPVALRAMTQVTSFKPLVGTVLTIQRAKAPLNLAEVQVFSSVGWRK